MCVFFFFLSIFNSCDDYFLLCRVKNTTLSSGCGNYHFWYTTSRPETKRHTNTSVVETIHGSEMHQNHKIKTLLRETEILLKIYIRDLKRLKSMVSINCLVTNILQNIFLCIEERNSYRFKTT